MGDRDITTTKATKKVMVKCFSLKGIVPFHNISLPSPTLLSMVVLIHASKALIFKNNSTNLPSGRKVKTWRLLTKDQSVLSLVEGFKIPLLQEPKQMFSLKPQQWNKDQKELIDSEVKEMLEKRGISKFSHQEGEFLSQIFRAGKKDGGSRPVINLKTLNKFVPYRHFKMEGLHCLKVLLQNVDYLCKIDLKDAYFSVPLSKKSRKLVRFQWKESLYKFLCLCFELGPAPKGFAKLLKVPMSVLRRLMIRAIIFLDDLLIFGNTMEEILVARDSNISATAPRICDKFQEVCFRINSGNRVSGYDCELKDNDIVITSGKSSGNKESVTGGVQSTKDNLVRTKTFVRSINFHYSSYSPSTSSLSVSSTTTNSNTKEECILHGHSDIERYSQRGTCMVDKKFRIKQPSGHYLPSLTDTNADGCFQ